MAKALRVVGLLLVMVGMATGSYFVTRALVFGPKGLEMVASAGGPSPTPVVVQSLVTPRDPSSIFVGNLNGFDFYLPERFDYAAFTRTWSPKCVATDKGNNVRSTTESEWQASRLDFSPTYLPPGAKQGYVGATACEDDVIHVQKDYGDSYILSISRRAGPPFVSSNIPRERLEATTIGGRPAVIVHPDSPKGRTTIYMRDTFSQWKVHGFQLALEEIIKVAKGVK